MVMEHSMSTWEVLQVLIKAPLDSIDVTGEREYSLRDVVVL